MPPGNVIIGIMFIAVGGNAYYRLPKDAPRSEKRKYILVIVVGVISCFVGHFLDDEFRPK
jgi:hypothetical protein